MDKKILMLGWGYPPDIDGGLDIHVARLFEELRELGVDITLALPEERVPEDDEGIFSLDSGEGDMMERARNLSKEFVELAEDYDIVHTHDWFGAEPGLKAKKYADVKWISTFHSLSSQRSRRSSHRMQEMERGIIEKADKVLAVSEMLAEEVEEEYGRKPEAVHNGFSKAEERGKDIKEEIDIETMIFYVGRHAEQKGLEHLVYGFSKFLEGNDATLVLGGDGHMRQALEEFVEMLDIEENVIFEGFISKEELGDYYASADVFVSPSINEPFGLTVTEAVEAGTPVVATRNGAEELLPGNAIVRAEPDSDSIAEGIKKAMNHEIPDHDSRSWKDVAEETIEIYREIS